MARRDPQQLSAAMAAAIAAGQAPVAGNAPLPDLAGVFSRAQRTRARDGAMNALGGFAQQAMARAAGSGGGSGIATELFDGGCGRVLPRHEIVLGTPHEDSLDFARARTWARSVGMRLWSDDRCNPSENTSALFQTGGDEVTPRWDPWFAPGAVQTIAPIGQLPAARYVRVWSKPAHGDDGCGGRSFVDTAFNREQSRVRGQPNVRVYWWGLDGFGNVVSCAALDDIFLGDQNFKDTVAPIDGYWLQLKRGCFFSKPWVVRSSLMTLDTVGAETAAIALPGFYPAPVPAHLATVSGMIDAHLRGEFKLIGAAGGKNVFRPRLTGLRFWPVGSGGLREPWAFYYGDEGGAGPPVAAVPVSVYGGLNAIPSNRETADCLPPKSALERFAEGVGDLFADVAGGVTTAVTGSPMAGAAVRAGMSAAVTGGDGIAQGALGLVSSAVEEYGGPAVRGLADLPNTEAAELFGRSLMTTAKAIDLSAVANTNAAQLREAARGLAQRTGVDAAPALVAADAAQAFDQVSNGLGSRLHGSVAALAQTARSVGMPQKITAALVAEHVVEAREVASRVLDPAFPGLWVETAKGMVVSMRDVDARAGIYSVNDAYDFIGAVQAGGVHPLAADASVVAAAMDFKDSGAADRLVQDDRVMAHGTMRLLEDAALEWARQCSPAADEAITLAYGGPPMVVQAQTTQDIMREALSQEISAILARRPSSAPPSSAPPGAETTSASKTAAAAGVVAASALIGTILALRR